MQIKWKYLPSSHKLACLKFQAAGQASTQRLVLALFCLSFFVVNCVVGCERTASKLPSVATLENDESIVRQVENNGVTLSVEVRPKVPKLSELVELVITIKHPSTIQVESPVFGQSVGDFAVRDYSERSSLDSRDAAGGTIKSKDSPSPSISTKVIKYNLEPMFSGKHLIRSFPIAFVKTTDQGEEVREILQSKPVEIDVISEFGQVKSDLSQVDPMLEPLAPQENLVWLISLVVALLIILALFGYWILKGRNSKQADTPTLSPEQLAKIALDQLIAEELPSRGMVKEFYLRLTGIVRVFIEGKTGLRAPEQTTEEFLLDVNESSCFDKHQAYRLKEFLTAADLVKYAGQKPDETNIRQSVERAKEFIAIRFEESISTGSSPIVGEVKHG